jgi:hypothetical protein
MRITFGLTAVLIGTFAGGAARAEINYPWCLTQADGRISCSFTSFEQCRAAGMGKGAICSENPRYQGPKR